MYLYVTTRLFVYWCHNGHRCFIDVCTVCTLHAGARQANGADESPARQASRLRRISRGVTWCHSPTNVYSTGRRIPCRRCRLYRPGSRPAHNALILSIRSVVTLSRTDAERRVISVDDGGSDVFVCIVSIMDVSPWRVRAALHYWQNFFQQICYILADIKSHGGA